jgi:hypothetical protein
VHVLLIKIIVIIIIIIIIMLAWQGWQKPGYNWFCPAQWVKHSLNRAKPQQSAYIMVKLINLSRTAAEDSGYCLWSETASTVTKFCCH